MEASIGRPGRSRPGRRTTLTSAVWTQDRSPRGHNRARRGDGVRSGRLRGSHRRAPLRLGGHQCRLPGRREPSLELCPLDASQESLLGLLGLALIFGGWRGHPFLERRKALRECSEHPSTHLVEPLLHARGGTQGIKQVTFGGGRDRQPTPVGRDDDHRLRSSQANQHDSLVASQNGATERPAQHGHGAANRPSRGAGECDAGDRSSRQLEAARAAQPPHAETADLDVHAQAERHDREQHGCSDDDGAAAHRRHLRHTAKQQARERGAQSRQREQEGQRQDAAHVTGEGDARDGQRLVCHGA